MNEIVRKDLLTSKLARYLTSRCKRDNRQKQTEKKIGDFLDHPGPINFFGELGPDHTFGEICYFKQLKRKVLHCPYCNGFKSMLDAVEISLFKRYHRIQFKNINYGIRAAYPQGIDYIKALNTNMTKRPFETFEKADRTFDLISIFEKNK